MTALKSPRGRTGVVCDITHVWPYPTLVLMAWPRQSRRVHYGQHWLQSSDNLVCSVVGIYKFISKKSEFYHENSHCKHFFKMIFFFFLILYKRVLQGDTNDKCWFGLSLAIICMFGLHWLSSYNPVLNNILFIVLCTILYIVLFTVQYSLQTFKWLTKLPKYPINLLFLHLVHYQKIHSDTRALLLAPAEGLGLRPRFLLPFRQKRDFYAFLAYFRHFLVFSSNISNFQL